MTSAELKCENAAHAEVLPDRVQDSNDLDSTIHHPKGWWSWRLVASMVTVGLSMGLFGYDNSFAAPLVALPLFIAKYQGSGVSFTARNLDLMVPVPLVGAAMGVFIAAPVMERLGHLGVSVLTTTAPLYLSELVPAHFRGRAIGFCIAGVSAVGIIATTIVWATAKLTDDRSYKIPLGVQAACPVLFGILTLFCPESPLWDVQHDKHESARRTLMMLRNGKTDIVEAELSMLQRSIAMDVERRAQGHFWDIFKPAHLKRTLTAGALLCLNQVSGLILVATYSTVILVQSGVANPFQITVIISCLQFLGTGIGPVLVDKVGRRPVALVGFSILFVLDIVAGSLAAAGLTTDGQRLGLAATFILFGFFNSASFQSLAYVLPTEIPTTALREPTVAWSVFWSYVTAIITTFAVPQLTAADAANLGAKTAFIFAGCVFVTVLWTYFYIPETKARTMAEIDEMYSVKLPMRRWRDYKCEVVSSTAAELGAGKEFS
ncbi:hypothetical protein LTR72_007495 [Exophiala xenobiotica]|nr:hypothetical protein LTR41_006399 [Exophiala xenobiotica]KAK5219964.1 hypothetical protein LTR72_007495 [Exophiala xenobiotica]KAK5292781.1 hypothetical protein LTR14_005130 [Exophiala xenobiotica]KAK5404103.1 hypothetical protein LTR06_010036 [Exophiala xenobiotica]KAK5484383.1 hypothetical protein LTR55_005879 [Exophiala xenobiotica]